MKVKELIEELSKFNEDDDVMVYEDHFDACEPLDSVEPYGYSSSRTEDGKCFLHYWRV